MEAWFWIEKWRQSAHSPVANVKASIRPSLPGLAPSCRSSSVPSSGPHPIELREISEARPAPNTHLPRGRESEAGLGVNPSSDLSFSFPHLFPSPTSSCRPTLSRSEACSCFFLPTSRRSVCPPQGDLPPASFLASSLSLHSLLCSCGLPLKPTSTVPSSKAPPVLYTQCTIVILLVFTR